MGNTDGPVAGRDCPWWTPPAGWWVTNPAEGGCDCSIPYATGSFPFPSDLSVIPLRGNSLVCPTATVMYLPGTPPSQASYNWANAMAISVIALFALLCAIGLASEYAEWQGRRNG